MNLSETAVKAAKGSDTSEFLHHIAWTDVIEPKLLTAREALTRELVQATLNPGPKACAPEIAGKINGIDWLRNELVRLISEGREASATLGRMNISIAE